MMFDHDGTDPIASSRNKVSSDSVEEVLSIAQGPSRRSDIQSQASKCSENIFASYKHLHSILLVHETTIQRRWASKGKKRRTEVLLAAWPNMAELHRPDFEAFLSESRANRILNTKYEDAYLYPLINQEDLTNTRPLLLFLNARGHNHPAAFAMADARQTDIARKLRAVVPPFLDGHTMLFRNYTSAAKYGQIVSWQENPQAQNWLSRGLEMEPGVGLQVLHVQQRILDFLVKVCAIILHDSDLSAEALLAAVPNPLQQVPAPSVPTSTEPLSLVHQRIEMAYRVPSALDLEWLESLLTAERDACKDHIVSLREDPAYFADTLSEYREHREELLCEHDGSPGKFFAQKPEEIWVRALIFVVNDAYGDFEVSEIVLERLSRLRELHQRYSKHLLPSQSLPSDFRKALEQFYSTVEHVSHGAIEQFKMMWPTSPPMRPWFATRTVAKNHVALEWRPGALMDPSRRRLMMVIRMLWEGEESPIWGREVLLDELEYFLERDATAKSYVSRRVANMISALGVLVEGLRQVMLFQPWASSLDLSFEHRLALIGDEHTARLNGIKKIQRMSFRSPIIKLAIPNDGKFRYPVHKQGTREGVDAMRRAEANLQTFWTAVDAKVFPILDAHQNLTALRKLLGREEGSTALIPQKTPPWSDDDQQASCVQEAGRTFPAYYYEDLERRTRTVALDEQDRHIKAGPPATKTRATKVPATILDRQQSPRNPLTRSSSHRYVVPKRALKVFKTIFFTFGTTSHVGDIAWRDFVDALNAVGLVGQKLRGSAWRFAPAPDDANLRAAIHFHEPHPSVKLPFFTAGRYGTRLRRLYGWHSGTFTARNNDV